MLWIVGKSFSEFRRYLEDAGISFGIFWDSALPLPDDVAVPIVELDFTGLDTLHLQLQAHPEIEVSAVIVAGYENYVLAAAYISQYYDLPGPSPSAALAATDKAVMREAFLRLNPALTPGFATVTQFEDIERFMQDHSFPVMLKPANLMKSLLVTKSNDMQELRANFDHTSQAIAKLYKDHSVAHAPVIVIEEFMAGTMHTIAAFVDAAGEPHIVPGVVDCITGQEAGFQDNFLYCRSFPSTLPQAAQQEIIAAGKDALRALGLRSCPAHIELILTRDGPKIIEVGARIGGYRPRIYEYAEGIDLYAAQLAIAYGERPALSAGVSRSIAVFELFPDRDGVYAGIANQAALMGLPSLRHFKVKPDPGTEVGMASHGFRAVGVVILGNDNPAQFTADCNFVQQNVHIKLGG